MLFNSIDFALFLPLVFTLYWLLNQRSLRLQNALVVVASYLFYAWWDWRFLSLIVFSTLVDYTVGLNLATTDNPTRRKALLWTRILVNLRFLVFFTYFNFFVDTFVAAFSLFGVQFRATSLNIILPVGISFYTFQTLSYTIDVYKRKLEPTRDLLAFSAFVGFFPQLVAGPIERATNLLPQFFRRRVFDHDKAIDGLRQILWGLFKKVVVADNCAHYANMIFSDSANCSGSTLLLGALFFTFQIYGDFSGYSDIAIGTARLFGFNLMRNFAFPYFSRDIAEFWRRWHISLSTWFRDYLYIPLGGSRGGTAAKIRNTFAIFVVSGFWHGANWTFIVWGALNAVYFLPLMLLDRNRANLAIVAQGKLLPSAREVVQMATTFGRTVVAWIFFRAENVTHALQYLAGIASASLLTVPDFSGRRKAMVTLLLIAFQLAMEWVGREQQFALAKMWTRYPRPLRWMLYYGLVGGILYFSTGYAQQFIYFQF